MDTSNAPDHAEDSELIETPDSVDAEQDTFRNSYAYLTPAMQAFAEHWAINRNQTKAYQHAYPTSGEKHAKDNARHLIRDARVQSEIRRILERWTNHSVIEISRIERELSRIATSDPRGLFNKEGELLKPHRWDADLAACVSSVKVSTTVAKNGDVTVHRTVRMWDKHAAARTLLEAKGAFQKNKPPPGVMAAFTFNFAGGQGPNGPQQPFMVEVGGGSAVPKPKTSASRTLQAPQTGFGRVKTRRKGAKSPPRTAKVVAKSQSGQALTRSDEIPTPAERVVVPAPVEISTPITKTAQTKPIALFGDAA